MVVRDHPGRQRLPERRARGPFPPRQLEQSTAVSSRGLYNGRDRARPRGTELDVNLCFGPLLKSVWERIFANSMATAAAIDRVAHHAVILEFDVPSYRTDASQQRGQSEGVNREN